MHDQGLIRIPYYPQLQVLNREDKNGDYLCSILSIFLYWYAKERYVRFNLRQHGRIIANHLGLSSEALTEAIDYLIRLKILSKSVEKIETKSDNSLKKIKYNEYLNFDFHALHERLADKGVHISVKMLRLAADDGFEFYTHLIPKKMPQTQGLKGAIKGQRFLEGAIMAATLLCTLAQSEEYNEFTAKALSEGYSVLCKKPVTPAELAERYLREGERAVDIDLTDGTFFIPDGDYFGAYTHQTWHSGKQREARILGCALYLAFTYEQGPAYFSDLACDEITDGLRLLYRLTGKKGLIGDYYYEYQDVTADEKILLMKKFSTITE